MKLLPIGISRTNLAGSITLFGLSVFAFGLTLSISITEIGIGIAFAGWVFTLKKGFFRKFIKDTPLLAPWTLYILIALISAYFAMDTARSMGYLPSDLIKMFACVFLLNAVRKDPSKIITAFYLAGATVASIWALGQFLFSYLSHHTVVRVGASIHPVTFGEVITLALIASVVFYIRTPKENKLKLLFLAQTFLFGTVLILSQSRGAMLGAIFSMMAFWIIEKNSRKFLTLLAVCTILAVGIFSYNNQIYKDRILSFPKMVYSKIFSLPVKDKMLKKLDPSTSTRFDQWRAGLEITRDYPLFGIGPSNTRLIFSYYHPDPIDGKYTWGNLHNLYIHQTAERGIAGLGALMYLLVAMFVLAWRINKKNCTSYSLWALCILPGFFVMNITETSFQHSIVSMAVFLALALAYTQNKQ